MKSFIQYLTEGGLIVREPYDDGDGVKYGYKTHYITDINPIQAKGKQTPQQNHLHFNDNVKNFIEHEIPHILWKPFILWLQADGIIGASKVLDKIAKKLNMKFYQVIRSIEKEDSNYLTIRKLFNEYKGQPKDIVLKASGKGGSNLFHVPLDKLDLLKFVAHANLTGDSKVQIGPDPDDEEGSNTKGVFTGGVGEYRDPDKGYVQFAGGYMPARLGTYTNDTYYGKNYQEELKKHNDNLENYHPKKRFNVSKIANEKILTPVDLEALYNQGWLPESRLGDVKYDENGKRIISRTMQPEKNLKNNATLYKGGKKLDLKQLQDGSWYVYNDNLIYDENGNLNHDAFIHKEGEGPVFGYVDQNPKLKHLPPLPVNPAGVEEYRIHGKHKSDFEKLFYSPWVQKEVQKFTNKYSGDMKLDAQTAIYIYLSSKYRTFSKDILNDSDKLKKAIGSAVSKFKWSNMPTAVGQTSSGDDDEINYDISDKQHSDRLQQRDSGKRDTSKKLSLRNHHENYNELRKIATNTALKIWAHCLYENKFKEDLPSIASKKSPLKKDYPVFSTVAEAERWLKNSENFSLNTVATKQIEDTSFDYGLPEHIFNHYKNILLEKNEIQPHPSLSRIYISGLHRPSLNLVQAKIDEKKRGVETNTTILKRRKSEELEKIYESYKKVIETIFDKMFSNITSYEEKLNLNEIESLIKNLIKKATEDDNKELKIQEEKLHQEKEELSKIKIINEIKKINFNIEKKVLLINAAFHDYITDTLFANVNNFNKEDKAKIEDMIKKTYGENSRPYQRLQRSLGQGTKTPEEKKVVYKPKQEEKTNLALDFVSKKINNSNYEQKYNSYKNIIENHFNKLLKETNINFTTLEERLYNLIDKENDVLDLELEKKQEELKEKGQDERLQNEIKKLTSTIEDNSRLILAAFHDYLLEFLYTYPDIVNNEDKETIKDIIKNSYGTSSKIYEKLLKILGQ